MVLMDVKAAFGAPIPRAFMPPKPAEYLELQKKMSLNILLTGSNNQFQNYEVLSFTDFITNQIVLIGQKTRMQRQKLIAILTAAHPQIQTAGYNGASTEYKSQLT